MRILHSLVRCFLLFREPVQMDLFFWKKKNYVLMHKNIPVLKGEYDKGSASFTKIADVCNAEHVPYSARDENGVSLKKLNHWYHWRGIPDYRQGLSRLLDRLDAKNPRELLNECHAVSVSDHYWLKEENEDIQYEDVSFFRHSFDQDGFGRAMFSLGRAEVDASARRTPNNTLAGYQKKAWFRKNGELVLYKGGTLPRQLEPVHEKLACEIGRRLGMDVIPYSTAVYENQVVSVCANMLDEAHELITAEDVLSTRVPEKDTFALYTYMDILQEHGVPDVNKAMDDMLVLDFLMMNTDRHNQNLGVIINADTMQWEKAAPIFDTGTGLGCLKEDSEVEHLASAYSYRLFNSEKILDNVVSYLITDLSRYDLRSLRDIPEYYYGILKEFQALTGIRDERIVAQVNLLVGRINALYKLQKKGKHNER